jgi:hypothetical protein
MIGGRLNAITFALRICCPSAKRRPIEDCAISAALVRSAKGLSNGTIKPVFGSFAALRIAGLGARRALKPPEITSPFFNNVVKSLTPLFLSDSQSGPAAAIFSHAAYFQKEAHQAPSLARLTPAPARPLPRDRRGAGRKGRRGRNRDAIRSR